MTASSPGAGQASMSGTADDLDTGRAVLIKLRDNGAEFGQVITAANGTWGRNFAASAGAHRYCAVAVDDNGLAGRTLGCVDVNVA
jgi:hypothetical protein